MEVCSNNCPKRPKSGKFSIPRAVDYIPNCSKLTRTNNPNQRIGLVNVSRVGMLSALCIASLFLRLAVRNPRADSRTQLEDASTLLFVTISMRPVPRKSSKTFREKVNISYFSACSDKSHSAGGGRPLAGSAPMRSYASFINRTVLIRLPLRE